MLDRPPPSRLRVQEKAGRLIVVDTQTGEQPLSAAQLQGGRNGIVAAAPNAAASVPSSVNAAVLRARPSALDRPLASPATVNPLALARPALQTNRQGRVIMVVIFALVALVILITSGLWMFAIIGMLIPPIRNAVWSVAWPAIKRFLDGAG